MSVSGGKSKNIPSLMDQQEGRNCRLFLPGVEICFIWQYPDASLHEEAPYFPLNGDSKYAYCLIIVAINTHLCMCKNTNKQVVD